MEKITFCIPSKNNRRYLEACIPSIRKNSYRGDHDIIVFVDADNDGTVDWLESVKDEYNLKYIVNDTGELYGIGRAYDYCIAHSTTDIFMIFHADMMLGKHADLKAYNHLKEKTVVCSTRVEPPLHPNAGEKILLDFGMWPEEFKEEEFDKYVESQLEETKTTEGIFAPWMMYKEEFFAIGGHDPIMHSCREDSDIFNRMLLAEFNFIQPWNSLVYHLTGRGAGSFDGDEERHKQWQRDMNKSTLEFIRKWGSTVKHTPLMKPIVTSKYDIGLILKNIKENIIQALEPWCSNVYVDPLLGQNYIYNEDKNTSFDLKEKIKPLDNEKQNQILVEIDGNKFTQQDYQYIQQLPEILDNSTFLEEDYGDEFEVGNLRLTIIATDTFEKDLIKI